MGETTSLSVGCAGINHCGVYPAWIIHNPDVVELVNDGQTYIIIKAIAEGTCLITCDYYSDRYDENLRMYVLNDKQTQSWTITVSGNSSSGSDSGTGDEGDETYVDLGCLPF